MTFPRVVSESGLSKSELAYLYGVSRQTIYDWMAGAHARKPSYTVRIAETITRALLNAVDRKLLPLPAMERDARKKRLELMWKRLQGLKPAPVK